MQTIKTHLVNCSLMPSKFRLKKKVHYPFLCEKPLKRCKISTETSRLIPSSISDQGGLSSRAVT